jgi:hypothetical protein
MEPRDKNRLDQWLDHALQHYGDAEPRPGLEARILANLAVSSDRVPARTRWAIAFASVAAIAVVAVVLWSGGGLLHDDKTSEKTLHPPVVETQNEKRAQTIPVLHREGTSDHRRRIAKSSRAATKASAPPHLNQFPSPRPLSEHYQII